MSEDPPTAPLGLTPAGCPQVGGVEPGEVGLELIPELGQGVGEAEDSPSVFPVIRPVMATKS